MTSAEVIDFLQSKGSEQTRKIYARHGAREPFFGVKIADLKGVLKRCGKNQALAEELWRSGNSDAMYLAALMADEGSITAATLRAWVQDAYWYMLSESGVAGVAAESPHGWKLGLEWIADGREMVASAGWVALSSWVSLRPDGELDGAAIKEHVRTIGDTIHGQQNRVRYTMNNYVICVGVYVEALSEWARRVAARMGTVRVNMGETACRVPVALDYIDMCIAKGRLGKKRARARC